MPLRATFSGQISVSVSGVLGCGPGERRWCRNGLFHALIILALAGGCRQDMHDQPKYRPLRGSELFEDKRSARPLVENTGVAGPKAGTGSSAISPA